MQLITIKEYVECQRLLLDHNAS